MMDIVEITVNGEPRDLAAGTALDALVEMQGASGRGFAVAVDGEVVSRADWSGWVLSGGQAVEILVAVQGG